MTPPASSPKRLPVLQPERIAFQSSLDSEGRRKFVHPADVRGRFATSRRIVFPILIAIWIALPLVKVGGTPLVLLDVAARRFHLFGATFNSQDVWLVFFLVTGVAFALVVTASLAGRAFCGYACPQTVFLDGVFRPIERLVEGSREKRMRRDKAPWTAEKIARKVVKHALYLAAAFLVAHVALSFFVPLPETLRMVASSPTAHPEAFAWAAAVTLAVYGNFAFFREQLCLVMCPYGRLQAALVDEDTLVIGYDTARGEPRGKVKARLGDQPSEGKAKDEGVAAGDCIDCKRCVVVCPTGIDIRNGLQLDCIGCTACVDACDEIMDKIQRPRGLVRYDAAAALQTERSKPHAKRFWRPRLAVYAVLGVLGLGAAILAFSRRTSFEASLVRPQSVAPFVVEDGRVRNSFTLHVVNKADQRRAFDVVSESANGVEVSVSPRIELGPMENVAIPLVASVPTSARGQLEVVVRLRDAEDGDERVVRTKLVKPAGAGSK